MNKNIRKILIANRGEIACRIIRTCREMGIETVAVYSEADKNSLHVSQADHSAYIGPSPSLQSYLKMDKIIEVAKKSMVDAIHPGFGFLSENAEFAKKCEENGLIFIGPSSDAIRKMGSKIESKKLVEAFGVPVIPGYNGEKQDLKTLQIEASKIGMPVLIKASAGGGGKGMRVVRDQSQLTKEIEGAKRDALAAFGDDTVLIEKYFDEVRHVEIQVLADQHGNAVSLFERECSIQRRHQKIIEESPSVALTEATRQKMSQAALNAVKSVNYSNAGTVEFILDNSSPDKFYFLEMNTRLQVEHPVTEMVTGVDLVKEQIRIAQGEHLRFSQTDLRQNGHAIECRLYAEDPENNYLPCTGKIHKFEANVPAHCRLDCGIAQGDEVSIYYDPMLAKLVAWGENRQEAILRMQRFLENLKLLGPVTNQKHLNDILSHKAFRDGKTATNFLTVHQKDFKNNLPREKLYPAMVAGLLITIEARRKSQERLSFLTAGWSNMPDAFSHDELIISNQHFKLQYRFNTSKQLEIELSDGGKLNISSILFEDEVCQFEITTEAERGMHKFSYFMDKKSLQSDYVLYLFDRNLGQVKVERPARFISSSEMPEKGDYLSRMPGKINKILVKVGTKVKKGEDLLIIESMKMENVVGAQENGTVKDIFVGQGELVEANTKLISITEDN